MSSDPITSHGRGGKHILSSYTNPRKIQTTANSFLSCASGAGNIERDEKAYTDGEIVREGPLGDQGDGTYSSGVRHPFVSSALSSLHTHTYMTTSSTRNDIYKDTQTPLPYIHPPTPNPPKNTPSPI